jgi:hypothetical protein
VNLNHKLDDESTASNKGKLPEFLSLYLSIWIPISWNSQTPTTGGTRPLIPHQGPTPHHVRQFIPLAGRLSLPWLKLLITLLPDLTRLYVLNYPDESVTPCWTFYIAEPHTTLLERFFAALNWKQELQPQLSCQVAVPFFIYGHLNRHSISYYVFGIGYYVFGIVSKQKAS